MSIEYLELDSNTKAALLRQLQTESPEAEAQRARALRVSTAKVIDTAAPDPAKWQVVYRNDNLPRGVVVQNQVAGIELHDPDTDEVATCVLRVGVNWIEPRFFDSFEADRDVAKLVALGAIQTNPPGLAIGVETFPPQVIEHFSYVMWHYAHSESGLRYLLPAMPAGAKRKLLVGYLDALAKERTNDEAEAGLLPSAPQLVSGVAGNDMASSLGLNLAIGARPDVASVA